MINYTELILAIELLIKKHRSLKLQPIYNNLNYPFLYYAVYKRFNCLHFFSFFKC